MVSGTLAPLYTVFELKLGSGHDRGQSPIEWGDFSFVCLFLRPSVHSPPRGPKSQPGRHQIDGQMDGRSENLPILQDFIPYWGHSPTTGKLQLENCIKRGKGTADHMMSLGDWLTTYIIHPFSSIPEGIQNSVAAG